MMDLVLWEPESGKLIPRSANTPAAVSDYAVQLSNRDKRQIVGAFDSGHYEMAINYLWSKTATALKKELSVVGVQLLGEMLGRTDVNEEDDVEDILTSADAIRVAEELGVVSPTDAMRLRHTNELVTHFSNLDTLDCDVEEIDEAEAMASLKACIKGVLGRPKVDVAKKFVEFRGALEGETLRPEDPRVEMLQNSPYFFLKLTISVLMNAAKRSHGATLEHALANINLLVPVMWDRIRDTEKWQIGKTYAEAYADGEKIVVSGLKSALLKVQGFDFVPENLRSDTFIKAADQIIIAHEGMNNFYNEASPVKNLLKLGSTIPTPALPSCMSALLCVVLGNYYGTAWGAVPDAFRLLDSLSSERWTYYLNRVLPGDLRILNKLLDEKPRSNWFSVSKKYGFQDLDISNSDIKFLVKATIEQEESKIQKIIQKLRRFHLGKKA
ncbi:MAG: hypothetical protein JW943_16250 [Deltaproteobacteria bacterium]|nr:hypothetical protein [Deltaproteobacteria bacterium]